MTNTVAIHCTTFWKDIHYYKGMLCSLRSFARGWSEYNVVVPDADYSRFLKLHQNFDIGIPWHVHSRPEPEGHGHPMHWLDQMTADRFTNADFVTYIDSDCIFLETIDAQELLDLSQPSNLKAYVTVEPWGDIHPARRTWRQGTEDALGIVSRGETMCGFPATYHRCFYPTLRERIEKVARKSLLDFVIGKPGVFPYGGFSEFVTMGNWALFNHPERHTAINPGHFKALGKLNQFWSHRQINEVLDPHSKSHLPILLGEQVDMTAERCYHYYFNVLYDRIREIQL
jgi:hypothetical protein